MDEKQFERELGKVRALQEREPSRAPYWSGYERGLRRALYGAQFGSVAEHIAWIKSAESDDPERRERGRGYADGLKGETLA